MVFTSIAGEFTRAPLTSISPGAMSSPFVCVTIPRLRPGSDCFFMVFMTPRPLQVLPFRLENHSHLPGQTMPRQRGRTQRGSPWHPRRPRASGSPPGSLSTLSSPLLLPEIAILNPSTAHVPRFECLALIDTRLSPSRCHLTAPSTSMNSIPPPASDITSSKSPTGMPSHGWATRRKAPMSSNSRPDLQWHENFTILYDLVFELRQGVEDLHFWLQLVDGRLSTLLQLLSTYQEASPVTSKEAPSTASDNEKLRKQGATKVVEELARQEVKEAVMAIGKQAHFLLGDAKVIEEPVRQEFKEAVVAIDQQAHISSGDAETILY
jgi:hypothetical protein